jgi:hypothetical protein
LIKPKRAVLECFASRGARFSIAASEIEQLPDLQGISDSPPRLRGLGVKLTISDGET